MGLADELQALRAAAESAFAAAADEQALEAARVEFLGARGKLKALLSRFGEAPREERPALGRLGNEVKAAVEQAFETAKARLGAAKPSAAPGQPGRKNLDALKQERREKLKRYNEELEKRTGRKNAAYGGRFPGVTPIREARRRFPPLQAGGPVPHEQSFGTVKLAARVMLRRDQSRKLIFLTVQDQDAQIQVALWNKLLEEWLLDLLRETLDLWDILGVEGELRYTQKGEPTLWAAKAEILSKCLAHPPDKFHGLQDKELRYRQRHLDLIANPDSRKTFILRAKAVARLRRFLDERGFLEMETPVLQTIPGGAAARPFETTLNALDMKMYLRIATEIPLKKLMVGGLELVYELGRIFRNEGVDYRHNPEFTTVEVYQAYGDLRDMMELTETAVSALAKELAGSTTVQFRGRKLRLEAPWPRLEYCELLKQHAGVAADDEAGLDEKLRARKLDPAGMSLVDKIDKVFGEYCEEHLQDACFVIEQPVEMSPLCRAHPENPKIADRFEAFCAGMEIANAYSELNDAEEQKYRLCEQHRKAWEDCLKQLSLRLQGFRDKGFGERVKSMLKRIKDQTAWSYEDDADKNLLSEIKDRIQSSRVEGATDAVLDDLDEFVSLQTEKLFDPGNMIDGSFLDALDHAMPPAGGLGIGIDRVVMLLAGADSIRDVIPFPLMRPEEGKTEAEGEKKQQETSGRAAQPKPLTPAPETPRPRYES